MEGAVVRWARRVGAAVGRQSLASEPGHLPVFDPTEFAPALRTRMLILQPTPFCNIDCDYCYLPQRASTARMSLATLRAAAQRLLDDELAGPELTVVWHAGEPMTLPPSYYDEAMDLLSQVFGAHTVLRHAMQTNAMRVDDDWCALIRRRGVRVGVSLDGTPAMHDAHRRTRSGKGTHAAVVRGIERLQAAGIPLHAIAVVGPQALADPDAFADAFTAVGITRIGCNFDEQEGVHAASAMAGREPAHAAFLARLAERMDGEPGSLIVRELATAGALIARPLPQYRWRGHAWPDNAQVIPFALVNVAHDGGFGTFSPELLGQASPAHGDFRFGNVQRDGYLASAASAAFLACWHAIVRGVQACARDCAYFGQCGGGAPANKLYELGDLAGGETLYCRTMHQRPFDTVLARAEARLARRDAPVA